MDKNVIKSGNSANASLVTNGGLDARLIAGVGESLAERIARILQQAILDGQYQQGRRLHEVELSRQLNVSRTPIREAFRMLEKVGLVSIIPRRGVYVKQVTRTQIEWLLSIRAVLDGLAASLAAEHASDEDVDRLKGLIAAQALALKKDDLVQFHDLGQALHKLVYEAGGNRKLVEMHGTLKAEVALFPFWDLRRPGEIERSLKEHRQLLRAIKGRDPAAARSAGEQHILRVKRSLLDMLDKKVPAGK